MNCSLASEMETRYKDRRTKRNIFERGRVKTTRCRGLGAMTGSQRAPGSSEKKGLKKGEARTRVALY
jgi:hypothetical protein